MVHSIVDIPLSGQPLESAGQHGQPLAGPHFLAGPENRLVEIAVRSVVEEPADGYNPLVLYGPSGTGKSHLARGLATVWKERKGRQRVVLTTAVDFARELAEAIESQGVEDFRQKYRTATLLVVEDLGQLAPRKADKLNAQEELIHTIDALRDEGRWVVVTAATAPAELTGILPALQSRLMAGLTVPLGPPAAETRRAILRQLAEMRNVDLSDSVAEVLAEGLPGTAPQLAGALMQLALPAERHGRAISVAGARQYLAARNRKHHPSLHEIALATARHFSLPLSEVRSAVRRRNLVTARGVASYLARTLAGASLEEIGEYFGGRDHTTVLHSCRRTEKMLKNDPAIHRAVEKLQKDLWKN